MFTIVPITQVDIIHLAILLVGVNYLRLIAQRIKNQIILYINDQPSTLDKLFGGKN